jgi:hypothetical protein
LGLQATEVENIHVLARRSQRRLRTGQRLWWWWWWLIHGASLGCMFEAALCNGRIKTPNAKGWIFAFTFFGAELSSCLSHDPRFCSNMATYATSTAGIAQFNRVLNEFKSDLTQDDAHDFNFTTSSDLKQVICQLQEEQKLGKRMQNLRRLSAFLEAMDQFDKVVHVFLNASDYLGFIWVRLRLDFSPLILTEGKGPAKLMLLVASSYSEALNTLLDAYQEIGEHMPLLEQYETHIGNNSYLQEIVGLIYQDILKFHHKAMKHFRQRGI